MSKFFLTLLGTLFVMFSLTFLFLFSSFGNSLIKPYLQKFISSKLQTDVNITTFSIGISSLDIKIELDEKSFISLQGSYNILYKNVDLTYKILLDNVKINNQVLKGNVDLDGDINGSLKNINIIGNGSIFASKSSFNINLKDKQLTHIVLEIQKLPIEKLFILVSKPIYSTGELSIKSNLSFQDLKGDGKLSLDITNAILNTRQIQKDFNVSLPTDISYSLTNKTNLDKNNLSLQTKLLSNLANIDLPDTKIDLLTQTAVSTYTLFVKNLEQLQPLTKTKLRGEVTLNGNINVSKTGFIVDGHSDIFDGDINFKLNMLNLNVKANKLNTIKLAHMTYSPEVFKSSIDANIDYNVLFKKGNFEVDITDGHLLPTKLSKTIKTFTTIDITKAIYDDGKVKGTIKNNKIVFDFDLNSSKYKINSKEAKIDLDKSFIDSIFTFSMNKYNLNAIVKGQLKDPAISLDSSYLKNKFADKKKKLIEKTKEKLETKLGDKAKNLLKSFF